MFKGIITNNRQDFANKLGHSVCYSCGYKKLFCFFISAFSGT